MSKQSDKKVRQQQHHYSLADRQKNVNAARNPSSISRSPLCPCPLPYSFEVFDVLQQKQRMLSNVSVSSKQTTHKTYHLTPIPTLDCSSSVQVKRHTMEKIGNILVSVYK